MKWDVIVIGVGGMGSAIAYHVAARGRKVLALEQFNIPNDLGSSLGVNRIIRLAYAEDPRRLPLLRRAYRLWRELGRTVHERLLFVTGGIDAGDEDSWIIQGSIAACKAHRLRHELLTATQVRKRFPAFQLPKRMVAVYQPDGGFVLIRALDCRARVSRFESGSGSSRARARAELGRLQRPRASAHRPRLVRGSKTGDRRRPVGGEGSWRIARPRHARAAGASLGAA